MNKNIKELVKHLNKLKTYDELQGRKAAKAQTEKEQTLSEIINILKMTDSKETDEKIFLYD